MPEKEKPSIFRQFRNWLSLYGDWVTLKSLLVVAVTFFVSYFQIDKNKQSWNNSVPWFLWLGMWFFGTALVSATGIALVSFLFPKITRRLFPPTLALKAEAGNKDVRVTVRCVRGNVSGLRADGRIVRLLDNSRNPNPHLFSCRFNLEWETNRQSIAMSASQWAFIRLAWMSERDDDLYIYRSDFQDSENVEDGAIVELHFRSNERINILKHFKISLIDNGRYNPKSLDVTEVTVD